jgi:hypothetical protein
MPLLLLDSANTPETVLDISPLSYGRIRCTLLASDARQDKP